MVCGESETRNPRDATLVAALAEISGQNLVDCRFMLDRWPWNTARWNTPRNRMAGIWKRVLQRRIKGHIRSGRLDLVVLMKNNGGLHEIVGKWARVARVPTAYDLWVSRVLVAERDGANRSKAVELERRIIANMDIGIATSEPYREFYTTTLSCPREKIAVIPLAVTEEWLAVPRAASIRQDVFAVSYWGSFLKQHGVEVLLAAARLLEPHRNIEFHLFGDAHDGSEKQMLRGTGVNVHFHGRAANKRAMIEAVDRSNIGVGHLLPIHDAHLMLPNKALEGMARGKPVIHIDAVQLHPQYGKLGARENCVYFYQGGAVELARAILELRDNSKVAVEVGAKAHQCIEQLHSTHAVRAAVAAMMAKALDLRRQKRVQASNDLP